MDVIYINALRVDAIIGVYKKERNVKQPLIIDIEMEYDTVQVCVSDNLEHALDYYEICQDIYGFVSNSCYQLIETLADAIAQRILNDSRVKKVNISLSKPQALEHAGNVGIRISRK